MSADESKMRELHAEGNFGEALTETVKIYGGELYGFVLGRTKDEVRASEIFSEFVEDLWRGFPKFEWKCSLRTWSYTLLRHAAARYFKHEQRRRAREVPLSRTREIEGLVDRARTSTARYLRTEEKELIRKLREELSEEEQDILVLRVDRGFGWEDIAQAMAPEGAEYDISQLKTEAARLRKQFQRVKTRLRALAERDGILEAQSSS